MLQTLLEQLDMAQATDILIAGVIFIGGIIAGYIAKKLIIGISSSAGLNEFTEGTAIDRFARSFETTTIGMLANSIAWIIYIAGFLIALEFLDISVFAEGFTAKITNFIPNIIVAVFVVIFGVIIGDKSEVYVSERLEEIHVSSIKVFAPVIKYSVIFLAVLMALNQLGVSTTALHILLAGYLLAIILFGGLALRTLLSSGVSGLYILTSNPYSIGDRIKVGEREGVVQEIDMFTTRIEDDDKEYVIPNQEIFDEGVSKEINT